MTTIKILIIAANSSGVTYLTREYAVPYVQGLRPLPNSSTWRTKSRTSHSSCSWRRVGPLCDGNSASRAA